MNQPKQNGIIITSEVEEYIRQRFEKPEEEIKRMITAGILLPRPIDSAIDAIDSLNILSSDTPLTSLIKSMQKLTASKETNHFNGIYFRLIRAWGILKTEKASERKFSDLTIVDLMDLRSVSGVFSGEDLRLIDKILIKSKLIPDEELDKELRTSTKKAMEFINHTKADQDMLISDFLQHLYKTSKLQTFTTLSNILIRRSLEANSVVSGFKEMTIIEFVRLYKQESQNIRKIRRIGINAVAILETIVRRFDPQES